MKRNAPGHCLRTALLLILVFTLSAAAGTALAASLTFPSNLQIIEEEAFRGDSSLNAVILPDGIKRIESRAFADCTINSVYFPSSIEYIADDAFDGCNYFITCVETDSYAFQYLLEHHLLNDPLPEGVAMSQKWNDSYTVSGFSGSCVDLKLPTYYHGYPVVEIANDAFNGASISGTLTLPSMLEKIGNNAFLNCRNLTGELYLPDSVTYLGEQAFRECSNFNSLRLSPNIDIIYGGAFYKCSGFTGELVLPAKLREIRESWKGWFGVDHVGAFEGCTGFTGSLVLPDTVTRLELRAFQDCSGFNGTLQLGSALQHIGESAFLRCSGFTGSLIIPDTVTEIGRHAFYRCSGFNGELRLSSNLTIISGSAFYCCYGLTGELNIPYGITRIDYTAFFNCWSFSSLVLPETLVSLGDSVFQGCSGFTGELRLPSSLRTIDDPTGWSAWNNIDRRTIGLYGAFKSCRGFTSLVLPEGITKIGNGAFSDCSGLRGDLIIPESVVNIGSDAFANCGFDGCLHLSSTLSSYGASAFIGCSQFTGSLAIPSCVTSISGSLFMNCSGFNELVLPDSLTFIGDKAFEGCSGFRGTLKIPSSVTSINWRAFYGCSGFQKLILNEGLETITKLAFYGCSGLTGNLWIPDSVTSIGWEAFSGGDNSWDTVYFGTGLTSLGVSWNWATALAGIIGSDAKVNKIIFTSKNMTYIDGHSYFNTVVYCYQDTDTSRLLDSMGVAYQDLSAQSSWSGSLFSDMHLHISKNQVETGEIFHATLSGIDTASRMEFRYEVWLDDVLVEERDWSFTPEADFVENTEGIYTIRCYARLGELLYALYPYNVSVVYIPHVSEPSEEEMEQFREEAHEHMLSLLSGVLPPDTVICVLKDQDVSGFDKLLLIAEDVVNFKLSDLLIPYNKTKFLFNDALARSATNKDIKLAKAEFLPDAVKQLGQVSKIEVAHVQSALYSMCSQSVLSAFESSGNDVVKEQIKNFIDGDLDEFGAMNQFLDWGVSENEVGTVLDDLKWLKDLHTISSIMDGFSSSEKVVNSAIDVYNQIALMSVMDYDELAALARVYLESDDIEMKLVGTTLLAYCYSSYAECVKLITYGKLIDIGMNELMSSVASDLVASASEPFLLTVKITNTIINIWSGAGDIPKYIFEIGFAADAVRKSYNVLISRYSDYLQNHTDEKLEKACVAYIKYHETCIAAEKSYQKLYEELFKKPISHALICADQELLLTIDFSVQNISAMEIMAKAMRVRLNFCKGGSFQDYIAGLYELKNMIAAR